MFIFTLTRKPRFAKTDVTARTLNVFWDVTESKNVSENVPTQLKIVSNSVPVTTIALQGVRVWNTSVVIQTISTMVIDLDLDMICSVIQFRLCSTLTQMTFAQRGTVGTFPNRQTRDTSVSGLNHLAIATRF